MQACLGLGMGEAVTGLVSVKGRDIRIRRTKRLTAASSFSFP